MRKFTDARGWYPGLELRGASLFNRDIDASAVIASRGNAPYTTRIVTPAGDPLTDLYGLDLGFTVLSSGNPADSNVAIGVSIEVLKVAKNNSYATVRAVTAP